MSITFACPNCAVQIEVGDEFAGMEGQCPRCQNVIPIPSPNMPKPRPTVAAIPAKEKWEDPLADDRPRPPRSEGSRPRTRRPSPPKQPSGPIWPWVVGIGGAIVVLLLLFISFIVLVSYRPTPPARPVVIDMQQGVNQQGNGVTVGRLEGQRAILIDGVFQIRGQLNNNDPLDRFMPNCRSKRFEVHLLDNTNYFVEVQSNHFDPSLRLENLNGDVSGKMPGHRGPGMTRLLHQSVAGQQPLVIYVTGRNHGLGDFTLTIRQANLPPPNVP